MGGRLVAQSSNCNFHNIIQTNGLIDVGFKGNIYTRNNLIVGKVKIQERIDRGFINDTWKILFPHAFITYVPTMNIA